MKSRKFLSICLTVLSLFSIPAAAENVRLGYYEVDGFQKGKSPEDIKSGFGYEYIQLVATKAGWIYDYVYGSKTELLEKLRKGEIDMMAGVEDLAVNRNSMLFPNAPMGEVNYCFYKSSSNDELNMENVSNLNGRNIGAVYSTQMMSYLNRFVNENDIDCEILFYQNLMELKTAVADGEVDCLVESGNRISVESGLVPMYSIGEDRLFFAVSPHRQDLLDKLNDSLDALVDEKPYFLESLMDSYTRRNLKTTGISHEESEWIRNHPVIRVGFVKEYLPFCDEEKGSVIGILPDVLNDILKSLGIYGQVKVEYVWDDSYWNLFNRLAQGDIDVVFPVYKSLWHAEELGSMETDSVCPASCDFIYHGDYSEELSSQIAISEHSPIQKIFADLNYPDSEIVWCQDAQDCLLAVAAGRAKSTIFSSYRATFKLDQRRLRHLKSFQLSFDNGYSFAVSQGNTMLLGILNKGISCLNDEKITMKIYEYTNMKRETSFFEFIMNHLLEVLLIVFVLVLVFILLLLRHSMVLKNASLQLQNQLEMVDCLARDYQNVYRLNTTKGTFTVVRMSGQSLDGIKGDRTTVYPYDRFMKRYIGLRVYGMDAEEFERLTDLNTIRERLAVEKEFSHEYRVFDEGKIHYYKFRCINLGKPGVSDSVIVAFSNIDNIIKRTKEFEMLKYKAEVDGLLGIANRSSGENAVRQMIGNGINGLLLVIDVDKFKTINDTYGHQAGDTVLQGLASCMKNVFSETDVLFRLGGDEFMVVVPNIESREEAMPIVEKFMESVDSLEFVELQGHKVSVSIGATIISPESRSFDEYYAKADSCVYESKRTEGCAVSFSQ